MPTTGRSIGIQRIEGLHYYVHDLERTRRFFVDKLDFVELGHSGPELERDGHQRSAAFSAGEAMFVIHQPVGEGGRAWRYLRKHPEGVGTVVFDVEDIDRAFALLDERGGTFITDVQRFRDDHGTLAMFSITTPFGDTTFRFVERRGYGRLFPGFVPAPDLGTRRGNRFGFERIDHLTSNFQTMKPALLWMEHVLGFEQLWEIAFHTNDVAAAQQARARLGAQVGGDVGSGLGREVRQQRTVPAVLQGVADQPVRRGQPRRRRAALGAGGGGHRGARCAGCAGAASSSWRRRAATTTCCRRG